MNIDFKLVRTMRGFSQKRLSKEFKVSQQFISKLDTRTGITEKLYNEYFKKLLNMLDEHELEILEAHGLKVEELENG